MADPYILLTFHAVWIETPGVRSGLDQAGYFVCAANHPDPQFYLEDVLSQENLRPIQIGQGLLMPIQSDWGKNQKLRDQAEKQGYGLSYGDIAPTDKKPSTSPPDFSN